MSVHIVSAPGVTVAPVEVRWSTVGQTWRVYIHGRHERSSVGWQEAIDYAVGNDCQTMAVFGFRGYCGCPMEGACPRPYLCSERGECPHLGPPVL